MIETEDEIDLEVFIIFSFRSFDLNLEFLGRSF